MEENIWQNETRRSGTDTEAGGGDFGLTASTRMFFSDIFFGTNRTYWSFTMP
jgi:hypothetical protein